MWAPCSIGNSEAIPTLFQTKWNNLAPFTHPNGNIGKIVSCVREKVARVREAAKEFFF